MKASNHGSVLSYADDIVLMAPNERNLQKLLDIVANWCCKWRLSINQLKSKVVNPPMKQLSSLHAENIS